MIPLVLALSLLSPPQDAPPTFELGQLAPDLALESWLEPEIDEGRSFQRNINTSGKPGELAGKQRGDGRAQVRSYHGVPLIVHTLAWNDATCTGEVLPLMRDLVRANEDRGIAMIGVSQSDGQEDPAADYEQWQEHELAYPVAREDLMASESPYVDLAANGLVHAFVIGPNGALLWRGDPAAEQRDFLAAVDQAYGRTVVPALERPLHPVYRQATADYLAGRLHKVLDQATKLMVSADDAQREDGGALIDLVHAAQEDWRERAHMLAAGTPRMEFLVVARDLRACLPKSKAAKELKDIEKDLNKKTFWTLRSKELKEWLELREERPALFPARSSKAGDRFARKLEKYLRKTNNSHEATQAAETLLARYALAKD